MSSALTPGPLCLNPLFLLVSQTLVSLGPHRSDSSVLLLWSDFLTLAPFSSTKSPFATLGLYSSVKSYSSHTGKFLSAISWSCLPSALLKWQSSCYKYDLQQPMTVAPRCKRSTLLRYWNVIFRILLSESTELSSVWLRHHTQIWWQARSSHPAPRSFLTATKTHSFRSTILTRDFGYQ